MTADPTLDVDGLHVTIGAGGGALEVVRGVSFAVSPGEILAIVGESGSGKTITALSIMGLLPKNAATRGSIVFEGDELLALPSDDLRRLRGDRLAMVFQEPMTSLNPVLTIGRQLTEGLLAHGRAEPAGAREQVLAMMERVAIDNPIRRLGQYPHELSGGMRQRVMIAMAMMMKPALLIADEPTTALDVTVQAQILDLIRSLVTESGTSLVLITHDMGVVAEVSDRVLVMRDGDVVEEADTVSLFATPHHVYTRSLLDAVPRIDGAAAPVGRRAIERQPTLVVDNVSKTFRGTMGFFSRPGKTRAIDRVSLAVMPGEAVALVGESGSGKSTLGRAITRLVDIDEGHIRVVGEDWAQLSASALRKARPKAQMIFQDPYASLDPRFTAGRSIAEPILIHSPSTRNEAVDQAAALLRRVGLDADMADRYPHEFSGGQRQRIAIARALAAEPKIIIADEPTSSLDVSIQAQILDLLMSLQNERELSLLFISHDFAVVRRIANRVAVMRAGRILEVGATDVVLEAPQHAYTKALLSSVALPDPSRRGRPRIRVSDGAYPAGPLVEVADGHWVAS